MKYSLPKSYALVNMCVKQEARQEVGAPIVTTIGLVDRVCNLR